MVVYFFIYPVFGLPISVDIYYSIGSQWFKVFDHLFLSYHYCLSVLIDSQALFTLVFLDEKVKVIY